MSDALLLLDRWRAGHLPAADAVRLTDLLRDPAARAAAVAELRFDHALRESLAAARAAAGAAGFGSDTRRVARLAPHRRLRRRIAVAIAALGALAAAIAVAVWPTEPAWARVVAADAGAVVSRAGIERAARIGDAIAPGDQLVGGLAIVLADGTRLAFADAAASFAAGPGIRLDLDRGRLDAAVAPQPAGTPLVATTPHAEATVVGTRLSLAVDATASVLAVSEGAVSFRPLAGGPTTVVRAGASARAPFARLIVMSWNAKYAERSSAAEQAALIARTGTDVASLQEVLTRDRAVYHDELERLTGATWHETWSPCSDFGGNLVLSRLPPLAREVKSIGASSWPGERTAVRIRLAVGGAEVDVVGTHLDFDPAGEQLRRDANVEALLAFVAGLDRPVILAGDLNSEHGSRWIDRLETRFVDSWFEANADPIGPPTAQDSWRSDWVMRSREPAGALTAVGAWTIDTPLSEDDPILGEFVVAPATP